MCTELEKLAADYLHRLPAEDSAMQAILANLCFHQDALMGLADKLKVPTTAEELAMNAAIQFSLASVLRATRVMVIAASSQAHSTTYLEPDP